MDFREIVNLGLSEKEAKVYLAALELGKTTVQKIAQKAKVNRATTYVVIEALTKKGLMSSYHEEKKQYFYAEEPEKLNILFRSQEQELKRKKDYLEKLLPELKAADVSGANKPVVRYFEGKEGLRSMADELYTTKNKDKFARMIYSYDLLEKIFPKNEIVEMRKRRKNKKIKVRSIINDENNRLDSDSVRYILPKKDFSILTDIAIFGNKVRIANQKKPFSGLIIENKDIAKTIKILFDLAWDHSENLRKKKKARGVNLGPVNVDDE